MVEFSAAGRVNPGRNLPVLMTPVHPRHQGRTDDPSRPDSEFASQLIAARDQLPVQRARRRAGEGNAQLAYDRSARLGERRLPQGYVLARSV